MQDTGESPKEYDDNSPQDASLVEENPFQRVTDDHTMNHRSLLSLVKKQREKTFFIRNLSKMEKGSMRASILTIFSSTIGAGLLSLPKTLSYFGLVSGMAFLAMFGLLTGYTYRILNHLIEESGKLSYANVVAHYFGRVTRVYQREQEEFSWYSQ